MKKIAGIILGLTLFVFAWPALAQTAETPVSASEAGILAGVTTICWEQGDCGLNDILQVFVNVSDYILGIVGSLALLLFVIGGFYMLVSQGESGRVQKGKAYITGAIVGIIIVFVAYIGVQTIESTLSRGELAGSGAEEVSCTLTSEDNTVCGHNAVCYLGKCVEKCVYQNQGTHACVAASLYEGYEDCSSGAGICSDDAEEQCCINSRIEWYNALKELENSP